MDDAQEATGAGNILVVDDDLSARQTLSQLLERDGCEVRCAPSGQTAMLFAREEPPDLVLLDIRLPDVDGFEICRRLKEDPRTRAVPVVFLSALEEAEDKVKGFAAGGVDYITKPFHAEEVLVRVRTHVALHRMQSGLGRLVDERTAALQVANEQLRQHIEALNRSEKDLQDRLRFEVLLSDLSAGFVNVPADQVDREIENALRRFCEDLELDLAALWQGVAGPSAPFTLTQYYRRVEGPPVPARMDASESFPWAQGQIMAGKMVSFSSLADLPPEAARDQEVWRHFGIRSALTIPLSTGGGAVFGALSFNSLREERTWPDALVKRLQLVTQIFANALARKNADQELRESEARLSLAASSAGAHLWEIETTTGRVWATETAREFYGFAQDEPLTLERFIGMLHPEDRTQVRRAIEEALHSEQTVRVEYRVVLADGSAHWIVSRGRAAGSTGVAAHRLMGVSLDITERKRMEAELQARLLEIERLKQQLEQENVYLREEVKHLFAHEEIVAQSDVMRQVLALVEQVAPTESTVLISGETGTGKELIARAIHNLSQRKARTLITVNCASLPPSLIESELFGREKGAYTGALTMMRGRFEVADGSTLFLDEIGDLPLEAQAKLLRVLEHGDFERLGSTRMMSTDVRVIAASNRNLAQDVEAGKFRRDLFYRLNVFPISIPPLRERVEDIPLLAWAFVREFEKKMGKRIESIPRRALEEFQRYPWPGNVRELRNVIEHAMIVSRGKTLEVQFPALTPAESVAPQTLEEVERKHILNVLEKTRWRLTGQGGAAERLGMKRTTLQWRMKKLGINRPTS